jgi:hypothetical protein
MFAPLFDSKTFNISLPIVVAANLTQEIDEIIEFAS